jgi:nicotinamide phosphoribosyltransferase
MCAGGKETEIDTFRRLIKDYPTGVLSVVSDTWDYWKVLNEYAPALKNEIESRKPNHIGLAKLVFRPDSGDPEKIICGDPDAEMYSPAWYGSLELLWKHFGGTINEKGYKVLNQRVGLIYGDSITLERANNILKRMKEMGFASCNIVFGIGSYTYQYITRDTLGFAVKATAKVDSEEGLVSLFKDPVTDDGTKKSAKGLLCVYRNNDGKIVTKQECTFEEENQGMLQEVFFEGEQCNVLNWHNVRSNWKNS